MINERLSPDGAAAWYRVYQSATTRIGEMPEQFPFVPEREKLDRDVQHCLFRTAKGRTYRCVFIVKDDEALILRVRGPGQPELTPDEIQSR